MIKYMRYLVLLLFSSLISNILAQQDVGFSSWVSLEPYVLNIHSPRADHNRRTYLQAVITHLKRMKFTLQKNSNVSDEDKKEVLISLKKTIACTEQLLTVINKIIAPSLVEADQPMAEQYREDIDVFCVEEFPWYQKELKKLINAIDAQNPVNKTYFMQIKQLNCLSVYNYHRYRGAFV